MEATSRDEGVRAPKAKDAEATGVRVHAGKGLAAGDGPDTAHLAKLGLVGTQTDRDRATPVPSRTPGRDAMGERVRSHVVTNARPRAHSAAEPKPAAAPSDPAPDTEQNLERLLAGKVGTLTFERYFQGQAKLERTEDGLRVIVASRFLVPIVEGRFRQHLVEIAGGGNVRFVDRPEAFPAARPLKATKVARSKAQAAQPKAHPSHAAPSTQRDRFVRLEDFVVGQSNELAHMAALSISDPSATPRAGNLLVLHGGCGLGKTHLLRGMAFRYNSLRGSGGKAKYVTAEHFTNGFLAALRTGGTEAFRDKYRGVELLCLDDVHFLATKDATKAELLHTLDQILQGGCRLALASDEHPRQVEGLGKQLISRLLSGLTIELGEPDLELREAMVRKLARQRGLTLGNEVVAAIANAVVEDSADGVAPGSFRDIEGAMARVDAFHNLLGRVGDQPAGDRVAMSTVHQALGVRARPAQQAGPVRVDAVIEGVCRFLGVGSAEFSGRGRHRRVVLARALVAIISRQLTTASYPEIASAMGRPNHSSIITAVRRIERQIADEDVVAVGCEADGQTVGHLADTLAKRIRRQGR
ncbi:MAG: DnaA ATPase domain-containing protein [Phycisphaerales bacterium JB060]